MTHDNTQQNKSTLSILLVEDDDVDAMGIQRAFKNANVQTPIFRAEDGIVALEMLRGENGYEQVPFPFIILVDLNMPRMNGLEFIQELRKDPELKSSIVFVLTTSKHDQDKKAAYDLDVAGYIVKDNAGGDYQMLIQLLDYYWQIVELPSKEKL